MLLAVGQALGVDVDGYTANLSCRRGFSPKDQLRVQGKRAHGVARGLVHATFRLVCTLMDRGRARAELRKGPGLCCSCVGMAYGHGHGVRRACTCSVGSDPLDNFGKFTIAGTHSAPHIPPISPDTLLPPSAPTHSSPHQPRHPRFCMGSAMDPQPTKHWRNRSIVLSRGLSFKGWVKGGPSLDCFLSTIFCLGLKSTRRSNEQQEQPEPRQRPPLRGCRPQC